MALADGHERRDGEAGKIDAADQTIDSFVDTIACGLRLTLTITSIESANLTWRGSEVYRQRRNGLIPNLQIGRSES
jgi:hypothetical protein